MKQDANAVTLEYVNRWGDHHTLALYRDSYAMGGGFAISWRRLHDADKPGTFMFIVYGLYLIGYIMFFFGLFGAIGGAITGLSNGDASLLSGALGMGSIGLILIVAGLITNIVLMCLPSNPDGARFD